MAGELTWQAKVGERLHYIEAELGSLRYSVEYTEKEIELLEGRAVSDLAVWRAFGRQDMVEKTIEDSKQKRQFLAMAGVCAIFILLSCAGGLFASATGRQLLSQEVLISSAEQQLGPFQATNPGRAHRIALRASGLPVNSWAVVELSLLDHRENEYYVGASEFWDEEGRDSDGYWHESDLSASHLFRPEQEGQYTLYVAMDEATVPSVNLKVTVKGGVWLSRYFVIFGVLCAVLCFVFAMMGSGRKVDLHDGATPPGCRRRHGLTGPPPPTLPATHTGASCTRRPMLVCRRGPITSTSLPLAIGGSCSLPSTMYSPSAYPCRSVRGTSTQICGRPAKSLTPTLPKSPPR